MTNTDKKTKPSIFGMGHRGVAAIAAGACFLMGGVFAVQANAQGNVPARLGLHFEKMSDDYLGSPVLEVQSNKSNRYRRSRGESGERRAIGGFSRMSDEQVVSYVTRVVRHMSIEINATDEQEKQLIELIVPAAVEMKYTRAWMSETFISMLQLLAKETVDKEAVEQFRLDRLAEIDKFSKKWVTVVAEVSAILTLEQRIQVNNSGLLSLMIRGWYL